MIEARLPWTTLAGIPDPEPWGKAFSYSVFGHGIIFALFLLLSLTQKGPVQTVLTEIKFVPKPVVVATPTQVKQEAVPAGGGGEAKGKGGGGGAQAQAKHQTGTALTHQPIRAEQVATHQNM